MRGRRSTGRDRAYLVTEAPQARSAEISQRQRRYLLMMGVRVVCFIVTVVLFVNHAGWLTVIPACGAIALPYFAVVIANSRQQAGPSDFRPYEPRLPVRYQPLDHSSDRGHGDGDTDQAGQG
ncbi:MAG TPA: DUF3099 domain-containing protein [Streptosporangiaceae bacterium]|nr:DUF3099 domain-containing protein [Streptosporangiaceae bacterium]